MHTSCNQRMKKFWFKRKLYGWGWTPATWQGWLSTAVCIGLFALVFSRADSASHSASDTLIGVVAPSFVLALIFIALAWATGEEPRWQWGTRKVFLEDVLREGGVAVMPTDTTYGIVASALDEKAVHEVYRLRKRDLNKPFIILISDRTELRKFGVGLTPAQEKILAKVWPGSVSVVLPCADDTFSYLHRGGKTLAFRVPAKRELRALLRSTGPLVVPSANPQGHPVAKTIPEARAYFGHHVNFYQDGGTVTAAPSKLIDITDGTEKIIRG